MKISNYIKLSFIIAGILLGTVIGHSLSTPYINVGLYESSTHLLFNREKRNVLLLSPKIELAIKDKQTFDLTFLTKNQNGFITRGAYSLDSNKMTWVIDSHTKFTNPDTSFPFHEQLLVNRGIVLDNDVVHFLVLPNKSILIFLNRAAFYFRPVK